MILLWDNKGDGATVTAASQIATLPGSNVQQPHLSRKWHTAGGVKSSNIIFDMGAAVSCALGALLGTNLTAAATVQWRASTADPAVTTSLLIDTGVVNAGAKAGYGASYKTWGSVSARYWRADIADTTVADNLQIGRAVLGPIWTPSVNMELDWHVTALDRSQVEDSYGGQSYADARPQKRVLHFALDFMEEAEMYTNAFAMARASGVVKDILAIPDISGSFLPEQSVWGLLAASEPLRNPRLGLYRQQFTVKERL